MPADHRGINLSPPYFVVRQQIMQGSVHYCIAVACQFCGLIVL
jgi:hypothetical protein